MPITTKYHGIELPIIEPTTLVVRDQQFGPAIAAAESAGSTMITRAASIQLIHEHPAQYQEPTPLASVITTTDQELDEIAKLSETTILPHTWALWPMPTAAKKRNSYLKYLPPANITGIPADHILVAEVPIIRNFRPLDTTPEHAVVIEGLRTYRCAYRQQQLDDVWPAQVGSGTLPTGDTARLYLDIEPHFLRWR
jgi:hypothetical protein